MAKQFFVPCTYLFCNVSIVVINELCDLIFPYFPSTGMHFVIGLKSTSEEPGPCGSQPLRGRSCPWGVLSEHWNAWGWTKNEDITFQRNCQDQYNEYFCEESWSLRSPSSPLYLKYSLYNVFFGFQCLKLFAVSQFSNLCQKCFVKFILGSPVFQTVCSVPVFQYVPKLLCKINLSVSSISNCLFYVRCRRDSVYNVPYKFLWNPNNYIVFNDESALNFWVALFFIILPTFLCPVDIFFVLQSIHQFSFVKCWTSTFSVFW